jgi:hypothetical protein
MMRGVTVELPESARARHSEIELQRMQAEDAMRGCQGRINSLPRDADQLHERLAAERDRMAQRHGQLHQLLSKVNQWLMQLRLPTGTTLEPASAIGIKLAPGETVSAA